MPHHRYFRDLAEPTTQDLELDFLGKEDQLDEVVSELRYFLQHLPEVLGLQPQGRNYAMRLESTFGAVMSSAKKHLAVEPPPKKPSPKKKTQTEIMVTISTDDSCPLCFKGLSVRGRTCLLCNGTAKRPSGMIPV